MKVKDPSKLSNRVDEYKIRVRAYFRTPEMNSGSFRTLGTDTVTVKRGDSTGNTAPSTGQDGDIALLGPKKVPNDIITGAGGNVAQIRTAIDSWIDGQIKLNDIYDASRPLYSGYEIYGATIRSSKSNRVTDSVKASTAGISGFAVVWNIEAKLNANGSFDFSGTKIKALTWYAVITAEPDHKDVQFTYAGKTVGVTGPANTAIHESWHVNGFNQYVSIQRKLATALSQPSFRLPKKIKRLGIHYAASESVKAVVKRLESAVAQPVGDPGSYALRTAKTIINNNLTNWVPSIVDEGNWHLLDIGNPYLHNNNNRSETLPWSH